MKTITINHEPVELYKILKFESLVYGGGEAKMVIGAGYVLLNGEVETQKRKKVVSGDVIEFDGETFEVQLAEGAATDTPVKTGKKQPQKPAKAPEVKKPKRSAIRF